MALQLLFESFHFLLALTESLLSSFELTFLVPDPVFQSLNCDLGVFCTLRVIFELLLSFPSELSVLSLQFGKLFLFFSHLLYSLFQLFLVVLWLFDSVSRLREVLLLVYGLITPLVVLSPC